MRELAFGQPDNGIIQMAFTVPHLEDAMRDFTANLRAGPWFVFHQLAGAAPRYRGEPAIAVNDVALGFAGNMQIELIQPLDDRPSVYRETIVARGHGFHHFGVAARDFEKACAVEAAKGFELAFTDAVEGVGRVAYYDTRGVLPGMLELIEASPELEDLFNMMREAARTWDGTDPVRKMQKGEMP